MAGTPIRLAGPALVDIATATKYTVPAGRKALVRFLHISNPTAAAVDFTFSIGADAAATRLFGAFPIPADSVYPYWCYLPMVAGEILAANAGTDDVLTLTISGDETVA